MLFTIGRLLVISMSGNGLTFLLLSSSFKNEEERNDSSCAFNQNSKIGIDCGFDEEKLDTDSKVEEKLQQL